MRRMKSATGLFPATKHEDTTVNWITPREVLDPLGPFDLDPCASDPQPWPCAARSYALPTDGLAMPWEGRVFLNPPYGRNMLPWIQKMADHNNGVALLFSRTDTRWFKLIFQTASCMLFISHRILFHKPDGTLSDGKLAASVLVGWGKREVGVLRRCGIDGTLVTDHKFLSGRRVN